MGSGATSGLSAAFGSASEDELKTVLAELSGEARAKLLLALGKERDTSKPLSLEDFEISLNTPGSVLPEMWANIKRRHLGDSSQSLSDKERAAIASDLIGCPDDPDGMGQHLMSLFKELTEVESEEEQGTSTTRKCICKLEEDSPDRLKEEVKLALTFLKLIRDHFGVYNGAEDIKNFNLQLCLSLMRNSHLQLAKAIKDTYSVDLNFNREELCENPPLNHALRCSFNKRIVEWLVQDCGQDVKEVYNEESCLGYACTCAAGDAAEWFYKKYPESGDAASVDAELAVNDALRQLTGRKQE